MKKSLGKGLEALFGEDIEETINYDNIDELVDEDFMKQAMDLTIGKGFDYVYETAGNTITMKIINIFLKIQKNMIYFFI